MLAGFMNPMFGKSSTVGDITFIGHAGKNVSTGSQTVTYNASSAAGDLLVLIIQADDADTIATPTGWSLIASNSSAPFARFKLFFKIKDTDTTVFIADAGDHTTVSVLTFRNVDTTTPELTHTTWPAQSFLGNSTGNVMTGITTTVDRAYVMWVIAHDDPSDSGRFSNWTNANISSGTELIDISTSTAYDGGFGVWGGLKLLAGATGTTTVDWAGGSGKVVGCTLALRPAS